MHCAPFALCVLLKTQSLPSAHLDMSNFCPNLTPHCPPGCWTNCSEAFAPQKVPVAPVFLYYSRDQAGLPGAGGKSSYGSSA